MNGINLSNASDVCMGPDLIKQIYIGSKKIWDYKTDPIYIAPTAKSGLVYNGTAQVLLNAGSTNYGVIYYSLNNSNWSTDIPTSTNANTNITVYWRLAGGARHNDVPPTAITCSIAKVTPTVTAPTKKTLTYTGEAQVLANAGATDWGTLQYSSDNSTWSTNIPTETNAGDNYKVYYRVVGNSNINDVASANITCSIAKATPTYTAPTKKTLTYSGSALELLNAGSTNHGTILYSLDNSTWSTTIPTGTNATSYNVYWRLIGDSNHTDVSSTEISLSIAKVTPTITEPTPKSLIYTGTAQILANAGSTNFGTLQYSADNSTWSTTIPSATNAGNNYKVYYRVVGNSNIDDIASASITCSIAKADPTYTAPTRPSLTYNGSAQTLLGAGSTDHGTILYSSDNVTWSETIPTGTNATSYNVYWCLVGDSNHNDIPSTKIELNIEKVTPTVTAPTAKTLTYTGTSQALVNEGSTNFGILLYSLDDSTWSTNIPTGTNATSYIVYYRIVGDSNINDIDSINVECSIGKADPVYIAPAKTAPTYNGNNLDLLTAGSTSHGTFEYSSDNSTWSTIIPLGKDAISYNVYWKLDGDSNHNNVDSTEVKTTIRRVIPTVIAPTAKVLTYNNSALELVNAGSTNFGTLLYSLDNNTWSTSIPTATNYGSYTVYYRVVGDSNILSVDSESINCSISEKKVTATVVLSQSTYTYSGNACEPTVTVRDGSVIIPAAEYSVTYSNNINVGTATVTITDNEGGNYEVIGSTTFTINKAAPTVMAPTATTPTYSGAVQNLITAGSSSHGTFTYSTSQTGMYSSTIPQGTAAGNYTVWYKFTGDSNHNDIGATQVSSVEIAQKALTITAKAQTITYGNSIATGTDQVTTSGLVSGDSLTAITLTASTSNVPGGTITPSAAGTTNGAGNYSITYNTGTLTINKANPTYPAPVATRPTYSGSAQNLISAGSSSHGTFTYSTSQNGTYSSTIPTGTTAGTYTVWYKFTGDSNHNDVSATQVSNVAVVAKALTITAKNQSITYGSSISTGTSQVTVSGLVSGDSLTAVSLSASRSTVGSGTITPSAGATTNGIGNYSVTYIAGTLTVTAKALTITAKAQSIQWGNSIATGTGQVTVSGLISGDSLTGITLTPSTSDLTTTGTITPSSASTTNGAGNYSITYTAGTLTITQRVITITAKALSVTYGTAITNSTGQVTIGGSGLASDNSLTSISLSASRSTVGSGTITPSAAVIKNGTTDLTNKYSITYNTGTLTVTAKALTITAKALSITYGQSIATGINQVTTSGLVSGDSLTAITLTASTANVPGGIITPSAAATTNGISNYSVTYTNGTLTIAKATGSVSISGVSLNYNGSARDLATVSGNTGTMHYRLGTNNTWSTSIPQATNASTSYEIYWYMDASSNYNGLHSSSSPAKVTSSIAKINPTITNPTAKTGLEFNGSEQTLWNAGSNTTAGTFSYGKGTNADTYNSSWSFTPTDTTNYNTLSGSALITIAKKALTITANAQTINYGLSIATGVSQVTTNGLASNDSLTAITLTASTTNAPGGIITPSAAACTKGIGNYSVTYNTGTLTINKVSATGTAPTARSISYNGYEQDLINAGTASGGTMYYLMTTSNSKPTSTSNFATTIPVGITTGTYYVWWYVKGDSNHNDSSISSSAVSVTISKGVYYISISPKKVSDWTYDGYSHNLLSGGEATIDGLFTYGTAINAGSYSNITWTFTPTDTTNYNIILGIASGTVIVSKANRVSFAVSMSGWTYGGTATNPSVSGNNENGSVIYQYKANGGTYSSTKPTSTSTVGTYYVKATAAATTNYNESIAENTFTISQKALTITAKAQSIVYGNSISTGTNQVTVSGLVSGDNLTGISLTQSTTTVTTTGTITPSSATTTNGASNYSITYNTGSLSITARPINITASSASKTYDGTALISNSATAETTGTNRGLVSGHSMTSCTVTGTITTKGSVDNVASSAVIKSGSTDVTNNYSITYVKGTLTINAKALTITAKDQSIIYGSSISTGTGQVTTSGLVNGDSLTSVTLTASTSTAGYGAITPSSATTTNGIGNYSVTYAAGSLYISKRTVTFTPPTATNREYNGSTLTIFTAGSCTAGGTMYYSGTAKSFSTSTWSTTPPYTQEINAGEYTLYYYCYVPDTTNNTGTDINKSLYISATISKGTRSGAVSCSNVTYGSTVQATVSVNPSSWTGGGVTWGITNGTGTATINSSGVVTPTQVGTVTVTANVGASGNYAAYTATSKLITVSLRTVTSTAPTATNRNYNGSAQTLFSGGSCTTGGTMYYSDTNKTFSTSTWSTSLPYTLKTDAGTYIIYWYCYVSDTTNNTGTNINTINSVSATINKVAATLPGTISGDRKDTDHTPARATVSKDYVGGTLQYSTDNGSSWNNVTWYSGNLTANPSTSTIGDTSVKFRVNPDGNHTISSTSDAITLTVVKSTDASVTISLSNTLTYSGSTQTIATASNAHGIASYYIGYRKDAQATADSLITWNSANTTPLLATNAGDYYVYYKFSVDSSHSGDKAYTYVGKVTINKASRSGSVSCNNVTYGSTVTASVSGNTENGTITWGITAGTGTATISSGVVTPTKVGTVTVTASVAATANYAAYTATSKEITISQRTVTWSAPTRTNRTYNGNDQTIFTVGSCTAGGTMKYSSDNSTWSTSLPYTLKKEPGTYTIYYKCEVSDTTNNTGSNINTSYSLSATISKISTNAPVLTAGGTSTYTGTTYYATAKNGSSNPAGTIYYGTSAGSTSYSLTASSIAQNMTYMGRADVGTTTIHAFFRPTDTAHYYDSADATTTVAISNRATGSSGSVSNPSAQTYKASGTYSYLLGISGATGTVTYPTSITVKDSGNNSVTGWSCTSAGVVTVPQGTAAGSYTVTGNITVAQSTNYNAVSATSKTWTITINRSNTASASAVTGLVYNGTTESNGSAQTGITGSYVNWSGTTSAANAGSYTAYVTPDGNHAWSDGTTSLKTISWSIARRGQGAPVLNGASAVYHNTASASVKTAGTIAGGTATCPGTLTWTNQSRTTLGSQTATAYYAATATNFSASSSSAGVTVEITQASDASVSVSLASGLTYNRTAQTIATASSHGCTYYLALGSNGTTAPTSGWTNGSLYTTNAGTYYVWYKGTPDSNHSNTVNATYKGSVTINLREVTLTWGTTEWTFDGSAHGTTCIAGNVVSPDTCTVTLSGNSITNYGSTLVSATGLSNSNYKLPSSGTSTTISINKLSLSNVTITLSWISQAYNGSVQVPTATIKSGSTTLTSGTHYSLSYSNSSSKNAGNYTITASPTSNYSFTNISGTYTITKIDPTYTAPSAKSGLVYNGSSLTLYNGGSNTTPGSFSYTNGTRTNEGTQTVSWAFAPTDSTNYNTKSGTFNVTISKRPINITAGSTSKTYDGSALTYNSATAESTGTNRGLAMGHSLYSCTVTGTRTDAGSTNNVPSAAVIKSGSTDVTSNYSITYVNGTLTVNKADGKHGCSARSLTYNRSAQLLILCNMTLCTGTNHYRLGTSGSFSTSTPAATNAGSYDIYVYTDASTNYYAVGSESNPVKLTSTINLAIPYVTAPTKRTGLIYTGDAQNLLTGGFAQHSSSDSTAVAGTFSYGQGTDAGDYKLIIWHFTPTDTINYYGVGGSVKDTVTIAKADRGSFAVSMSGWTYGGTPTNPSVSGNSESGSVSYEYKVSGGSYSSTKPTSSSNAGTYYVKATAAATANYNASTAESTFVIAKAALDASVSIANWVCDCTPSTPSVSGNLGGGAVTYYYKISVYPDVAYTTTMPMYSENEAPRTIKAVIAETTNYFGATVFSSFTIYMANNHIDIHANSLTYNGSEQQLVYIGQGGISGNATAHFRVSGGSWSTSVSGPKGTNAGTYTVEYYVEATSEYKAIGSSSSPLSISVTIAKASRTATFVKQLGWIVTGDTDVNPANVTVGTGYAPSYSSSNTSVATIDSSGEVTGKAAGTTTITALFAEESNYKAASASYTLTVRSAAETYLTAEALSDECVIFLSDSGKWSTTNDIRYYYSLDDGATWKITKAQDVDGASAPPVYVGLHRGERIMWKGTNSNCLSSSSSAYVQIGCNSGNFKVMGNPASLGGTDFATRTSIGNYNFYRLFYNETTLLSARGLALPFTTLGIYCYQQMFYGCAALKTAPVLPATSSVSNCYREMFYGCTSLTTAPELPATTLSNSCYSGMFRGCTSLTSAPVLPATTMQSNCYNQMFRGCTSLTSAPVLPATTLVSRCYHQMFYGCSSLNYVKAMFTTTPSNSYTADWLKDVASSGTFVKNSSATWNVVATNGVPSGWTITTASS